MGRCTCHDRAWSHKAASKRSPVAQMDTSWNPISHRARCRPPSATLLCLSEHIAALAHQWPRASASVTPRWYGKLPQIAKDGQFRHGQFARIGPSKSMANLNSRRVGWQGFLWALTSWCSRKPATLQSNKSACSALVIKGAIRLSAMHKSHRPLQTRHWGCLPMSSKMGWGSAVYLCNTE